MVFYKLVSRLPGVLTKMARPVGATGVLPLSGVLTETARPISSATHFGAPPAKGTRTLEVLTPWASAFKPWLEGMPRLCELSPCRIGQSKSVQVAEMMANTVTNTNNLSLRSILEKDKLTGPNFLDWERNLMIVLRHERKWYVLEEPLPEAPPANVPAATRNAHKKHTDDLLDVGCLMLATISPDLQAGLMNTNAYDMIRQLRDMFQTQARTERYDATKAFNECKMIKGASVSDHVMKMKRHMDHLERLGHPVPLQLATDTILNSLSEDYTPFVVNYNMNNMEKSIAELHSMLKTAELNMGAKSKPKDVLMVRDGGVKKKHGKGASAKERVQHRPSRMHPKFVKKSKARARARARKSKPTKQGLKIVASHAMKLVIGGKTAQSVMKQGNSEFVQISKYREYDKRKCNMDYAKLVS
ncbi:hypothetical protein OSB04_016497 [Centaurea solstitialis]|uniref:Polyprotein n=1 Tax=Centaurea solstitialis TaxID=347529 RepID=A0AA38W9V2_9ASTR|nr:hypothetical protein OSB04_016497 [Centaurea solstitialis]